MIKCEIPTSIADLDKLISKELNSVFNTLKVIEHFERLAIIILLMGILCSLN